ncbi:MAG TPA: hypothetical protein VM639_20550 [Dongiaceae bacterium]|nr:hypothetical protein [Dongiaceae bacterium]
MARNTNLRRGTSCLIALLGLLLMRAAPAEAVDLEDQGLHFSDERGGFHLLSVTGTGSIGDPITVTEEMTGPSAPILIIRGLSAGFGNRVNSFHTAAFAMTKIIINRTDKVWQSYRIELREVETRPSDYSDGLSFGQNSAVAKDFTASPNFPDVERIFEPEDSITYTGGEVPPGGSAILQFVISDMSPIHEFYLFQQPTAPISQRDAPPHEAGPMRQAGHPMPHRPRSPDNPVAIAAVIAGSRRSGF